VIQAMNDFLPPPDFSFGKRLTHADLIGVVSRPDRRSDADCRRRPRNLDGALAKLRVEHQAVKDELARLKHLPPASADQAFRHG